MRRSHTISKLATIPPITEDAPYRCIFCGGGVHVRADDGPINPADVTGGYAHFACMKAAK